MPKKNVLDDVYYTLWLPILKYNHRQPRNAVFSFYRCDVCIIILKCLSGSQGICIFQ